MPNRISEMSKGRYDISATPWGGSNSSPYFHYALLCMKKIAGLSTIVITLMLPLTAIMAMISTVQPLMGQSEWFGYADVFSPNHEGNYADPSTFSSIMLSVGF